MLGVVVNAVKCSRMGRFFQGCISWCIENLVS